MRRGEWVVLRSRPDRSAGKPAGPVQQLSHLQHAQSHLHMRDIPLAADPIVLLANLLVPFNSWLTIEAQGRTFITTG
jgi:hypothetical protein